MHKQCVPGPLYSHIGPGNKAMVGSYYMCNLIVFVSSDSSYSRVRFKHIHRNVHNVLF